MSKKLGKSTAPRTRTRAKRSYRFHKKLKVTRNERPRLVIFRSNKFLYAQVIDDSVGKTVAQANSKEKDFKVSGSRKGLDSAKTVGKLVAERALKSKVETVVFDRNGYNFHGRVKALAEGAREAGLKF